MTAVFPSPSDTNPGVRRAALTLYAAHSDDRAWVLARLPEGDHALLRKLLAELASLGIPRDPDMVRSALNQATPAVHAQAATRPLQELGRINVTACAALLRNEPAPLVASVLALLPETARAQVREQLPLALRRQALAAPAVPVPSRLREALMRQLRERFGQGGSGNARPWIGVAAASLLRAWKVKR